jgi:hypothetical protein
MNRYAIALAIIAASASIAHGAQAVDPQRQADVARRGAQVMPFDLSATKHVFTKTADGGVQRVIANDATDDAQIRLIRAHLKKLQSQFRRGDFSDPAKIHGRDMPGLARLAAAKPGELTVDYKEIRRGAELIYRSRNPQLVAAIGAWFDAQLSDHGADAMEGHMHHHSGMSMQQ